MIALITVVAIIATLYPSQLLAVEECACGYRTDESSIYTEIIETDFTKVLDVSTLTVDWQVQEWKIDSNPSARVPLCRVAKAENVKTGDKKGLQMIVNAVDGVDVGVSEIRTAREDIKYGSFKVSIQTTRYQNDAREIDVELLSRELSDQPGQPAGVANFVIHSPDSVASNFDASRTNSFIKEPLAFDPTEGFHEYRIDWKPNSAEFFVDDSKPCLMNQNIPQVGGRIFLNHWSNGSPQWSGGPPAEDATMWVRYVRLYFNSSDPVRVLASRTRCEAAKALGGGNVCDVSNRNAPFILPPPTTSTSTITSPASASTSTSTITRSTSTITRGLNAANSQSRMTLGSSFTALIMLLAGVLLALI